MERVEEKEERVEEQEEQKKPRKKMVFTEEQLEKKRASMKRASDHRNKMIKDGKNKVPEPVKEPVIEEPIRQVPKIVVKPSKQISKYEDDSDDSDEGEIIEKVITFRKKKKEPSRTRKEEPVKTKDHLVEETYREQLQQQLNDERRRRVMNELFDF